MATVLATPEKNYDNLSAYDEREPARKDTRGDTVASSAAFHSLKGGVQMGKANKRALWGPRKSSIGMGKGRKIQGMDE